MLDILITAMTILTITRLSGVQAAKPDRQNQEYHQSAHDKLNNTSGVHQRRDACTFGTWQCTGDALQRESIYVWVTRTNKRYKECYNNQWNTVQNCPHPQMVCQ